MPGPPVDELLGGQGAAEFIEVPLCNITSTGNRPPKRMPTCGAGSKNTPPEGTRRFRIRGAVSPAHGDSRPAAVLLDAPFVSQSGGGGAFVWSIRQHSGHLHTFFTSVPLPSPKLDRCCRSYIISTSQTGHFGVAELEFLGN